MSQIGQLPHIDTADFARRFGQRGRNLMWLLGAGASAAAGIPTAGDMIWEFKQLLYVSQRRVSPQTVQDLSAPSIRSRLQSHIDAAGNLPSSGAPDEYSGLFEAAYPAESDRRSYLDAKLSGAKPSYGHLALATLMKASLARLVWTTNFDSLVADGCAKVFGTTGSLTTVALDAPLLAEECIADERWPIEVKLHGDFRSRRLMNTSDELRHQDQQLRRTLLETSRRFGLIVAGYSGRDSSIMETLEKALLSDRPFPSGLFWLHREGAPPLPSVEHLLTAASEAGVEGALVTIQNFDETLRDLVRLLPDLDSGALDDFAAERRRWSGVPRVGGHRGWPVVRLNALPVVETPSVCRLVDCGIGGYAELREAIETAGVDMLAARTRAGVLAFGSDRDVRAALEPFDITTFDLHPVEAKRLRYESGERGLLREALSRAISRHGMLELIRRRTADLLAPLDPNDSVWRPLRKLVGSLSGVVQQGLQWREGVELRLDWANGRLWLLAEPRIVFDGLTEENRAAATDFARERTVKRYNRNLNEVLAFWADRLANNGEAMYAMGIGDGVDARFVLSPDTGFSRRATL